MNTNVEIENLEEHFDKLMDLVIMLVEPTGGNVRVDFENKSVPDLAFMVMVDDVEWVRVTRTGDQEAHQLISPVMWSKIEAARARRKGIEAP